MSIKRSLLLLANILKTIQIFGFFRAVPLVTQLPGMLVLLICWLEFFEFNHLKSINWNILLIVFGIANLIKAYFYFSKNIGFALLGSLVGTVYILAFGLKNKKIV